MSIQPLTIAKPDNAIVNTGQVPADVYLNVFTDGKVSTSGKGFQHIEASFEIVSPDLAELPDGRRSQVAAKRGKVYLSIDPGASQYAQWYDALGRLNLLDENKDINATLILERLKTKNLFFYAKLDSEERIARKPARPGQKYGDPILHPITKKELTSGWDFKYIKPEDIICLGNVNAAAAGPTAAANATAVANRPY